MKFIDTIISIQVTNDVIIKELGLEHLDGPVNPYPAKTISD